MPFDPRFLILHDYGGRATGTRAAFNPYHALVSGGSVQYRNPAAPYAQPAPHAYKLNPQSLGLSWRGPVGGTPDPADRAALAEEIRKIKKKFPGIKAMGHGEAYAARGSIPQASKHGRDLIEASWRRDVLDDAGGYSAPPGIGPAYMAPPAGVSGNIGAAGPRSGVAAAPGSPVGSPPSTSPAPVGAATPVPQQGANTMANGQNNGNPFGALADPQFIAGLMMMSGNAGVGANLLNSAQQRQIEQQRYEANAPYRQAELEYMQRRAAGDVGGTADPSAVREFQFFEKLTPEQQKKFMRIKRADQKFDLGTSYAYGQPGQEMERIEKDIAGKAAEEVRGKTEEEKRQAFPAQELEYEMSKVRDRGLTQSLDRALALAGPWTTGFKGNVMQYVAGSPASDLAIELNRIQAQMGFEELARIRAAGGTLGSVTEREMQLLQAAQVALNQAQSEPAFRRALEEIKRIKSEYAVLKQRAYERDKQKYGAENVINPATGQTGSGPSGAAPTLTPPPSGTGGRMNFMTGAQPGAPVRRKWTPDGGIQ